MAEAPSVDETSIWHVLLSPGNVQQLTLEKLARYFDEEIISEQTYVWQKGMGEWQRLEAVLAEHPELPEQAPEQPFSVLMDDRSISKVYLDELADLYRLGIISGETLVWQQGMTGWERLGELADLDEDLDNNLEHDLEPAELQTNPFATRSVEHERATTRMNPRPAAAVEHEAPTLQRNAIPPQQPNKPAQVAVGSVSPYPLGHSTAPVAYSYAAAPPEESKGFAEKFFFRAGLAATVLLALLRNDALYGAATVAKKEADYLRTETRALGGPSFGTVRAVEELIRTTGGPLEPVRVPVFVTDLTTPPPVPVARTASSPTPPSGTPLVKHEPKSDAKSEARSAAPAPRAGALGGNVAAALLGQAKPAPQRAAASSHKATSRKAGASKSSSPSGSKNYYDPLNGAL